MKVLATVALLVVTAGCGDASPEVTVGAGNDAPSTNDAPQHDASDSQDRSMRWEPAQLGSGSWSGGRTSPDGESLLIALVGGPEYREGNPCTVAYDAEVEETPSEVRLKMLSARPPARGEFGCTEEGHFRTVQVDLAAPLGTRRLVEVQFDREQPVFDGSRLLKPTWLPDGFSLRHEGAGYPNPEAVTSWQRTWVGPGRAPDGDPCQSPISLTQGPAALVEEYPSNGEQARRTDDVRGATASYYDGGSAGVIRLAWTHGDEGFVLASMPSCVGDVPASEETLVRIARSLEAAGGGGKPIGAAKCLTDPRGGTLLGDAWLLVTDKRQRIVSHPLRPSLAAHSAPTARIPGVRIEAAHPVEVPPSHGLAAQSGD